MVNSEASMHFDDVRIRREGYFDGIEAKESGGACLGPFRTIYDDGKKLEKKPEISYITTIIAN